MYLTTHILRKTHITYYDFLKYELFLVDFFTKRVIL